MKYLDMAADLAELGRGRTNPNPMVGAVIVKNHVVVGKGFHERAGSPHAEVNALKDAGPKARGATLFVTLEPCCFQGRTPPCTKAIIEAAISEVVVGITDPNPEVSGEGIRLLRDAGISVNVVGFRKIARQNEAYFKYMREKKPFITLKIATSLDGKIAEAKGVKTRLSGDKAEVEVHKLRNENQAIMVGVGTVLVDDPVLSCRLAGKGIRQPTRIIVDSRGRLPIDSRIVETSPMSNVILATTDRITKKKIEAMEKSGVEVVVCRQNDKGKVDIEDLYEHLGKREITSLLVEGGSRLNEELIGNGMIDKLIILLTPMIIGGKKGVPIVGGKEAFWQAFEISSHRYFDNDLVIEMYPKKTKESRAQSEAGQAILGV